MVILRRLLELAGLQEALKQIYDKPLVRTVGADFPDTFLHGTARKNLKSLAGERPESSIKKNTGNELFQYLFPPEVNEFGADLFLAEPRQPQQANMFANGRGNVLAVVRLKPGTRILDLSDEVARAPQIGFGGAEILRFFHRPAITNDLMAFHMARISPGYRERHPDWNRQYAAWMDPTSPDFKVRTWQDSLVPYAETQGYAAIRFADEVLLIDRAAISDVRLAKPKERAAAATTKTYQGSHGSSLFTDQPTGAHDEYDAYHHKLKEADDEANSDVLPPDVATAFAELGDQQRGVPENAMLRVQFAYGGGVLNPVVEHVGDIIHRMSHMAGHGYVGGRDKIEKTYRWMTNSYGFEREFEGNLQSNARYREVPVAELRSKVRRTLRAYAAAHATLPVYNRAQWLARQASVAIGLEEWNNAREALFALKQLAPDEETWTKHALEYRRDASGHLIQWAP